jgi:polyhydroxyalkanoate synthesis repressor PhaR
MSVQRIIKKYPNRRLYDTAVSRYITLNDVRRLILEGTEFQIIDKRTQQDITRPVLLQVIAEQEQRSGPVLSQDFLSDMICCHDAGPSGMLSAYLEHSLHLFLSEKPTEGESTVAATHLSHQNYQRWHSAQEEIFHTLVHGATESPG